MNNAERRRLPSFSLRRFVARLRYLPAVLLMGVALASSAQKIPWILPWDDATAGVTDFSGMNPPIGSERVMTDTNGHFVVNGQRIRFLGVNFAADAPFMLTNKAESVAARVAKFGINMVRLHHMDASWAYNGGLLAYSASPATSTNFNQSQLERVQYLVSRLKAHGIYSDVNLLVGREYRAADGLGPEVTSMYWKDQHSLGCFYPPALELQKDYARKLLTPTNRFTGLPLAKDPAVAMVEILNENGMVQKWLEGALDRLPARYLTNLQARWNDWLAVRYASDAALQTGWNIQNQPLGANLVRNGPFTNSLASWNAEQHSPAVASFGRTLEFTNNQPSAQIVVTTPGSVDWYIQLNQANLRLTSNQVYTISFWAKSSPATNASASVMRAYGDYAAVGYNQTLALTTNWQPFTVSFQAAVTETNARVNFGSMGNKPATFWYADVRLQPGGQIGMLPAGTSLAGRSIPNIVYSGTGYAGTREARADWLRFLRDLEGAYYDMMVAYLRTSIGYTGLIFGTVVATSPATVQSRMDVIDTHAYWQHPQFPVVDWDPVNWYEPNISIVNTLGDDNSLAFLARQRVRGKPFTVTEYQHPSPNYYGAEGPVLLAAYAGLQDWDGLWLFDYGMGNDLVPMGFVRSYFDTAQHPTKMANLLLAANLFRRGDVQPALTEYTMALTPERELDLLQNTWAWGLFTSSQLGVSSKLAFRNRLSTSVGTNAAGLTTPPAAPTGNLITSDTLQLQWNLNQASRGLVTIDTPRSKGLVGYADNLPVSLGGIAFQPGTTLLGWCTLGLTLVKGEVFTNDCTALLVASGWWENTGQVWKDSTKNSVGNQWGQAPVLTEVVPFTLTLPVGTNYVQVWSLDPRGQRKTALPVTGTSSSTTLTVSTNAGTIWYEIHVSRWVASFDLWRARYFTSDELAQPGISGDHAAPDGDGVANLWKYYLGLPGHTNAPPGSLPFNTLVDRGNDSYLALTFTHDKLVADVTCTGEVSADLSSWLAGPDYTVTEPPVDLGTREQITVRDAVPMGSGQKRFLRLRLDRP